MLRRRSKRTETAPLHYGLHALNFWGNYLLCSLPKRLPPADRTGQTAAAVLAACRFYTISFRFAFAGKVLR